VTSISLKENSVKPNIKGDRSGVQTEFLSNTNDSVVQNSDALNKQKAI